MLQKSVILGFTLGLLAPSIHAQSTTSKAACKVSLVRAGSLTDEALAPEQVDLQSIMLVGKVHALRSIVFGLSELIDKHSLSNKEFLETLQDYRRQVDRPAVENKKSIRHLKQTLKGPQRPAYVIYEATNTVTQQNRREYKRLFHDSLTELKRRGLDEVSLVKDLLLAVIGPVIYLDITEPEIFKNTQIIGLESDEATLAHSRAIRDQHKAKLAIRQATAHAPAYTKNLKRTEQSLEMTAPDYDYLIMKESLTEVVKQRAPEEFREVTLIWLEAMLNELKWRQAREAHIVAQLLELDGSAMLHMGLLHIGPINFHLRKSCE